jgi:hypothetical protein
MMFASTKSLNAGSHCVFVFCYSLISNLSLETLIFARLILVKLVLSLDFHHMAACT